MIKIVSIIAAIVISSCATAPVPAEAPRHNELSPALYTLKEGDKIQNILPLPDQTQILINWKEAEGLAKPTEGFRGWDMDHDGRFDVLEVFDSTGKTDMWAYDFDGDGIIDVVEHNKQGLQQETTGEIAPSNRASQLTVTEALQQSP
jgi:hypothetical protein